MDVAERDVLRSRRDRLRRCDVRAADVQLPLGAPDLHAAHHEVGDEQRDEIRPRSRDERGVERRAQGGDAFGVLAVPLARVTHEVDHATLPQERETADERGHAELSGPEDAALVGPPDRPDQMDASALVPHQWRERVEQLGGIVIAGHRDDGPPLREA